MKVEFMVGTNRVGSKVEEIITIDDSEIEGFNDEEIENYIESLYKEWLWENINTCWEIKE